VGEEPHGYPKSKTSRFVARALPPPVTSVEQALNYAGVALDRSIPLLDRWNFVATAVRLSSGLANDGTVLADRVREAVTSRLEASGLCEMFVRKFNYSICVSEGYGRGVFERLVKLVNSVDLGELPITDRLVELLAQTVIVLMAPVLERLRARPYPVLEG